MSDREAFIDWWESRHYDNEDREVKKASWCAWKAAREQEGGEAVERMSIGRASRAGIRFEDREIYCRGWNDCLESHPPQSQGVPEGLRRALVAAIVVAHDRCGDVDDEDGSYATTPVDRMIELETALCELFDTGSDDVVAHHMIPKLDALLSTPAAPQADEWVKCSDQLPKLGQRVKLFSGGVIQHYMPTLDEGDEGVFWDFEQDHNPLVDFRHDQWMPCPQPPEQGDGV
ncbi:DUF551 domain-containing protein [Marinobacter salarius]|uniref:DUF551 domain-containing protein n=1 Tax=Marinobacter salarius TaxID=1420917 RepID=UPI00241D8FA8|nr:DUF551 domain-containing protein [Marinobacter salarius]